MGPKESFASDKPDQALKMHSRHGSFEIDLKSARNVKKKNNRDGNLKRKNERRQKQRHV